MEGWGNDPALVAWLAAKREGRLEDWSPRRATGPDNLTEHFNIERRMVEGGYRRRQILELLQNAVDAAHPQRESRVTVECGDRHLYVANEGNPLAREGIETLLSSHASNKTGQIGKFGLGFKSLLGLSDVVEIFSHGISLVFDRARSEECVRAWYVDYRDARIPAMRLAWDTSYVMAAEGDERLRRLGREHTTVVRVRLRDEEARQALKDELASLRFEFLLFARKNITLRCDRQQVVVRRGEGPRRQLEVDGDATSWDVVERVVDLPRGSEAARDAGELHLQTDLPITWAIPTDSNRAGKFWAFFPLEESALVPGIVNAPFKTSDDRSNLTDGPFNHELLARCAELVVETLPALRTDSAVRHLDYLPRRGDGASALGLRFAEQVWERARRTDLGPDGQGRLVRPSALRTPPAGVSDKAVRGWFFLATPTTRSSWVHPDVVADGNRLARWKTLSEGKAAPIEEWVQAVASTEPERAAEVLRWVATLLERDANQQRYDGQSWAVALDRKGQLRAGRELLFDGGDSDACIHPRLAADDGLRKVLTDLGVRGKDARWYRGRLQRAREQKQWEEFWGLWREAPPEGREAHPEVCMRTREGTWRLASDLVTLGEVLAEGHLDGLSRAEVRSFLVDEDEHDATEREAMGVTDRPRARGWWLDARGLGYFVPWLGTVERKWEEAYPRRRGRRPDLQTAPTACALAQLLASEDEEVSRAVTGALQSMGLVTARFGFASGAWEVSHPVAARLMESGRFGLLPFDVWLVARSEPALLEWCWASSADAFLAGLTEADRTLTDERTADGRLSLASLLEPDQFDGADPTGMSALYCAAARVGCAPERFLIDGAEFAASEVRVHTEAVEEAGVLVVPEDDVDHFVALGLRRWTAVAPGDEGLLYGEPREATELFPWIDALLLDDIEATVQESLAPLVGGSAPWATPNHDSGRMELGRPNGCEPSREQVLRAAHELGWLRQAPEESASSVDAAISERAALPSLHDGTLESRLLLLVGRDVLARHLHLSDALLCDADDETVARVFLAQHGCLALYELRAELTRFQPPRRWGTEAAQDFAFALGFSPEFGGAARRRRERQEVVDGPPPRSVLHDFQIDPVLVLETVFGSAGDRAMLSLPTGAGKTRVTVEALVRSVLRRQSGGRFVLWVAQQDELCEQAVDTFKRLWRQEGTAESLTIHRLWNGLRPRRVEGPQVVVATIQSVTARAVEAEFAWIRTPSAVVVDEAHHAIAPSYTTLLKLLGADDQKRPMPIVGLSATPHRKDGLSPEDRWLVARFDDRLVPSLAEQFKLREDLERLGVLSRPVHHVLELPAGEALSPEEEAHVAQYKEFPPSVCARLALDVQRNELILDRAEAHLLTQPDARLLLFAASVNHARHLAARLSLRGLRAASVDGGTPSSLRRYFLREFGAGRVQAMVNCGVLTTGFDEPKVTAVLIARPTLSPVLYQQMVGRGLRGPANGGTAACAVITVADNFERFGLRASTEWFADCWSGRETKSERIARTPVST